MVKPFPGERAAYRRIKSDAAPVRREFSIPLEWFIEHCHKPCHYCGRSDTNSLSIPSRAKGGGWVIKDFKYNGLDRVDNNKGYTIDNCVPCCAVCNRGKNSMGYNEWMEYLNTLTTFIMSGDQDDYRGKHLRPVSFSVQGGDRATRDEVETKFTQGSYVSSTGNNQWTHKSDSCFPGPRTFSTGQFYTIRAKEKESD